MTTLLEFGRDIAGYNAYSPVPSTNAWSATIVASAATSITVPSSAKVWVASFNFSGGADVWVDFSGATAAIPAGATLAATTSVLNPGQRTVYAGDTISLITDSTSADVSVELYAVSYT